MEHQTKNTNVIICQTVHGLAQIKMYAMSFAHACVLRSSGYQYSYHIIKILILQLCQVRIILCTQYETGNWQLML